jgi:hypothetical protein
LAQKALGRLRGVRSAILRNIIILMADEHVCGLPVGSYANQPN